MDVLEWLVASFDMKIDNKGYESNFDDKLTEMHVDLKVKTSMNIGAIFILLLRSPSSEQQPNLSCLFSQLHI